MASTGKRWVWHVGAVVLAVVIGAAGAFMATLYLGIWLHEPAPQDAAVVTDNSFQPIAAAALGALLGPAVVLMWRSSQRGRSRKPG